MHVLSLLFLATLGAATAAPESVLSSWPTARPDLKALIRELGLDPRTTVSFPGSDNFTMATERWAEFDPPTYAAAVSLFTEEDIIQVVELAARYNVPFLATGARHAFTTSLGELNNGLALDLSNRKKLEIDVEARTLTIGTGIVFGDIFPPLYEAGLMLQTGVCSCPGMIGVTIGSGVGRLEGVYGMVADALSSVRIVLANGTLVTASREENDDLFWAIRGAGANFGVITEATYNLHPLYRDGVMTFVDIATPAVNNASFFEALNGFVGGDNELQFATSFLSRFQWDEEAGAPNIVTAWVYAGPEDEAREVLAPFLALEAESTDVIVRETTWPRIVHDSNFATDAEGCLAAPRTIFGSNLKTVDVGLIADVFDDVAHFYQDFPDARGSVIVWEGFPNQATRAVPVSDSAYPWRDVKVYALLQAVMELGHPDWANVEAWFRETRDRVAASSGYSGHGGLRTYVNYAHGDEPPEVMYGEHLARLSELKRKYDPTNAFSFHNAIPLDYES